MPKIVDHDVLRLEGWLKDLPHDDREARIFGMPYTQEEGRLRPNQTFRRGHFSPESMTVVLGWSHDGEIMCFWNRGEPMVLAVDADLHNCIAEVQQEGRSSSALVAELVEIGLLIWQPLSES